jgi:hypothetical protein
MLMHPRLLKIAIPKHTLARRLDVARWLEVARGHFDLLPSLRCPSDALRVATTYVLRDWSSWKGEDGTVYKALAASPTGQRGLVLDINVQIRKPDGVQYSETVCRVEALDGKDPQCVRSQTNSSLFTDLFHALDIDTLLRLGTAHLFDQDLRRLCSDLLSAEADTLWPGVWLCLRDTPAMQAIAELGTLVCQGSVTLQTLTLEQSDANRQLLADELAQEYIAQLGKLSKRLDYPTPNLETIERDYLVLCEKIRSAEALLGLPIACLSEQVTFEQALATAQGEG